MDDFNYQYYQEILKRIKGGDFEFQFNQSRCISDEQQAFENELVELTLTLKQAKGKAALINEVLEEIIIGMTLDEVLNLTFNNFRSIIPYDRIGCALLSDDGKRLTQYWVRTSYPRPSNLKNKYSLPLKETSLGDLFTHTQIKPRIINDLQRYFSEHPRSKSTKLMLKEGIQSSLTCPLIVDNSLIGFLFFSSRVSNVYQDIHQDLFITLSRSIAILVAKSRMFEQVNSLNQQLSNALTLLKAQSCYDPLTEVYHRGVVIEFLNKALSSTMRSHTPLAVVMVDIDHFKAVNDAYGHVTGDLVLKKVAQTIAYCLRESDCCGRYGGEEFLIVIPEADKSGAYIVAERIRSQISKLSFMGNSERFSVTVSMGIAVNYQSELTKNETELIMEADNALYEAKRLGRNKVVVSDD